MCLILALQHRRAEIKADAVPIRATSLHRFVAALSADLHPDDIFTCSYRTAFLLRPLVRSYTLTEDME